MTTLLAINPFCRGGDIDCNGIVQTLSEQGDLYVHRIGSESSLADAIACVGSALERIVVAGGDGTLNSVLADVLDAGVPLGVVPLGTANDFARSLALPTDPQEAARIVAEGYTRRVDVGVVNGRCFLNAVGIGLGPELTRKLDREKKKRLGVLAYLESLIQVVGRPRRRHARLRVDGRMLRLRFMQITIANAPHYGGGMTISDEARLDDERLHVLCVHPLTPWQLFLRALRIKFGAVTDDEKLTYCTGRNVEVETHHLNDVTADGELITQTPLRCHNRPGALEVYAPRPATDENHGSRTTSIARCG